MQNSSTKVENSTSVGGFANTMLAACGFSIGQKVQVFDGQKWEKTGDIGDNECFWIEATITGCNVNDYNELLIEVLMVDGRTSLGYYKEGVRHCR